MSSGIAPAFLENEAKKVKRDLEGWREVILPLYSVLTWKTQSAPAIIAGSVTFIFITLWYLEPSVLTTIAGIFFIAALLDYIVPKTCAHLAKPETWTAAKERQLEKICKTLAINKILLVRHMKTFVNMRNERPNTFYMIIIPVLVVLAWIGNIVNNLLLTYLIVLAVLMTPGLKERGFLAPILNNIGKVMGSKASGDGSKTE